MYMHLYIRMDNLFVPAALVATRMWTLSCLHGCSVAEVNNFVGLVGWFG